MSILRIAFLLTTLLPTLWAQQYTFQSFSVPGQTSTIATSINNRGAIVGDCNGKGFKRDVNGVIEFPISGTLTGINDSGDITGFYFGNDGSYHGFLLTGGVHGTRTPVDIPPGPDTQIYGINNLADFAGVTADLDHGQSHGFVSIGGVITQFDVPGVNLTTAAAVAWDGSVAGYYPEIVNGVSRVHGFVRGPKGNILRFKIAGAVDTYPQGINNEAGTIVGYYRERKNRVVRYRGFVYNYVADLAALDGVNANSVRTVSARSVDYPGNLTTFVYDVNAKGVLVGWTYDQLGSPFFSFTATPLP